MFYHTFDCGCKAEYNYANQFHVDGMVVTMICFKHMEYLVRTALYEGPRWGQERYFERLTKELRDDGSDLPDL